MKSAIAVIALLAIFIAVVVIAIRTVGWKVTVAISVVSVVVNYIVSALIRIMGE